MGEQKNQTREMRKKYAKQLKEHIRNGKTIPEAARLIGINRTMAYKIRNESMKNNTWFTPEELEIIERNKQEKIRKDKEQSIARKQEEKKKQKEKTILKMQEKKDQNRKIHEKYAEELKEHIRNGKKMPEAARLIGISKTLAYKIKNESMQNNTWLTEEELIIIEKNKGNTQNKKKEKETSDREKGKRQQGQQKIKEREPIGKSRRQKTLDEEKQKIKGYAETYKKYKKSAKREDRLDFNGAENVSTEGRRKFIELLTKLHSLGADISEEDIEIVLNTFYMYPEIANTNNIKFLILDANKRGGVKAAEKMVRELIRTLRNTKYYEPLLQYRIWVKREALFLKICVMKQKGMNNTEIGEKLGISSAEVSIIFYSHGDQNIVGDESK